MSLVLDISLRNFRDTWVEIYEDMKYTLIIKSQRWDA